MKVILYANVSINGMILLSENSNHQVPKEVLGLAMQQISEAGNLIMGRKSFDVFEGVMGGVEGIRKAMPGVELVYFSNSKTTKTGYSVVSTPQEAVSYLNSRGYQEVILGGGTETYNAFLKSNLVDEILFNVVPIVTTGGVLAVDGLNLRFILQEQRQIASDVLQVRWKKA